ncbi:MAG: Transcriptional regulator, IclR family [Actinomycetia bacterium]|nr:Transcriptional regulator, IclR family [Actinomycetes bacterium]
MADAPARLANVAARTADERADAPRSGAQAIERAIAILRCFTGTSGDRGISELASEVHLGASTVHRIVRALCEGGLLAQNPDTERYHLGPATALLGQLAVERLGFSLARAELEGLVRDTGESVNLGVRQGPDVLVVMRLESHQPLRFDQEPGTRVPVHASAMGKALLAFSAEPTADVVAALPDLERVTPNTITNRRRLVGELEDVRRNGYAINDEERNVGVRAIAAAVLDRDGVARAAIAVQGPTVRMTDARVATIAEAAIATARRVAGVVPLELL